MPVKKSAAAKKRAETKSKRGPGRPKGSKNKTTTADKSERRGPGRPKGSKNKVKEVQKPKTKRQAPVREINEETGFVADTDQDIIAQYLLEGGESRSEIADRLYDVLDNETRNGTEKQIVNMVSGVVKKMVANGFTIESWFRMVPPTTASKRAATRAANSAKKTAAKKTTSGKKRGPGRPKGSKNRK